MDGQWGNVIDRAYLVGMAAPPHDNTAVPPNLFDMGADKITLLSNHTHQTDILGVLMSETRWATGEAVVVSLMKVHCCELQVRLPNTRDGCYAQVEDDEVIAMVHMHGDSLEDYWAKAMINGRGCRIPASGEWSSGRANKG